MLIIQDLLIESKLTQPEGGPVSLNTGIEQVCQQKAPATTCVRNVSLHGRYRQPNRHGGSFNWSAWRRGVQPSSAWRAGHPSASQVQVGTGAGRGLWAAYPPGAGRRSPRFIENLACSY